jgi:hypothetical protein
MESITLTVVAVSTNTNSFGLHSVLCLHKSGAGWQLLKSAPDLPRAGDNLTFGLENDHLVFPRFHSWECPTKLPSINEKQAAKLIKSIKHLAKLKAKI